jgi:hypothetical protein
MITLGEIKPNDTVKVLLCDDDIEEETYAIVTEVFTTCMSVRYYMATSKVYKSACLYELDESENPIEVDSITEHYSDGDTPFSFTGFNDSLAYLEQEVDSEEDSEITDLSSDDEDDLEGFVVPDGAFELPPDHERIDATWNQWTPPTSGGIRFKNMVDTIDRMARAEMDNQKF